MEPHHTHDSFDVMEDILQGLNPAQRTAVASESSVLQVLAPPGSGKTKTLTARVAYFIAHRQLQPWNIIVCTFTVKAANEMKERITSFVGHELSKHLKLGTFHSVRKLAMPSSQYLTRLALTLALSSRTAIVRQPDFPEIFADPSTCYL